MLAMLLPWQKALNLAVFSLPFAAFELEMGLSILASQFVTLALLLRTLLDGRQTIKYPRNFNWLLIFILWCVGTAGATLIFSSSFELVSDGAFFRNGWGRVAAQAAVLILGFALVFIIVARADTVDRIQLVLAYIYACITLAVLGYLQISVYLLTGADIFPIGFFTNLPAELQRSGLMGSPIGSLLRMSSLGGEPKGLAVSLLLGLAALVAFWNMLPRAHTWKLNVVALLFLAMILTGSTSGFFGLVIFFAIFALFSRRLKPLSPTWLTFSAVTMTLVGFAIYLYLGSHHSWDGAEFTTDDTIYNIFIQRTIGRFSLDDTDIIIMSSLYDSYREWLMGRGMGLVHIGTAAYVPDYYILQGYYTNQIVNPKSGITSYGGAGGIIGLIFIGIFLSNLLNVDRATFHRTSPAVSKEIVKLQAAAIGIFALLLNRLYSGEISWILICLCGASCSHLAKMPMAQLPPLKRKKINDQTIGRIANGTLALHSSKGVTE
jgi:hypothetical protein